MFILKTILLTDNVAVVCTSFSQPCSGSLTSWPLDIDIDVDIEVDVIRKHRRRR